MKLRLYLGVIKPLTLDPKKINRRHRGCKQIIKRQQVHEEGKGHTVHKERAGPQDSAPRNLNSGLLSLVVQQSACWSICCCI